MPKALKPPVFISSSPHVHSGEGTEKVMRSVIYSLLPASAVATYLFGWPALVLLLFCPASCMLLEALCQKLMDRPLSIADGSAALTGLLLALNLPPACPWWMALLGSAIAIIVAKQVYGGLGHNPFNPALVARVVLLISFPVQMTTWWAPLSRKSPLDAVTTATPLGEWKTAIMLTGAMPANLQTEIGPFFLGNMSGSLGEVSALALLLGAAFLFWKKIITWHIPLTYLGAVVVISGLFWLIEPERYPNPLFHLFTGGLILGAFYMATDMVTSPVTPMGMFVFGAGCGVLTVLIRLFGGYPEGVSFAILLMNAMAPLLDRFIRPTKFGAIRKEKSG